MSSLPTRCLTSKTIFLLSLTLLCVTLGISVTNTAHAATQRWSVSKSGDTTTVLPCRKCKTYPIKFTCQKGSPKFNLEVNWTKNTAEIGKDFQSIKLNIGSKIYEFDAQVSTPQDKPETRVLSAEVYLDHDMVRALRAANSAKISIGDDAEPFKLRGSRNALVRMRKNCHAGKIVRPKVIQWTFVKAAYGEPHWITYSIPGTDTYVFGAFCQPKEPRVTMELFGVQTDKKEGALAFTSYSAGEVGETLKGRINQYGWPQTAIKRDAAFWQTLKNSRETSFQFGGKDAGTVKVKSSEPALAKFYDACKIVNAETIADSEVSADVATARNPFEKGKQPTLDDLIQLSTLGTRVKTELLTVTNVLNTAPSDVSCDSLHMGSLYGELEGHAIPPFKCALGDKDLIVKSAFDVVEENAASSVVYTDFSWQLR